MEDAVQTHKVLVERNDPAPVRVAPDAGGRKRRCDAVIGNFACSDFRKVKCPVLRG